MLSTQRQTDQEEMLRGVSARKEDPRVTRTRRLLLVAFMDLMKEKSFQEITIQDIAQRATINRVTFYAHFTDKYALLEYTIREMIRQRLHSQLPAETPFSRENLARLVLTVCGFLAEMDSHCPPPHGQMETLMEKQIKVEVCAILQNWLQGSEIGDRGQRPSARQIAMVTSWAIYGAAEQWKQQDRRESVEEYVQQMLPLILGSLQSSAE
jgi:AcrR family transcriptional regulator